MNNCTKKVDRTNCTARDYLTPKQQARVEKLLGIVETHHCTLSMGGCECVAIAQELSDMGYEFETTVTEGLPN